MQIREDFKVDFDGWHKEATSLFKRSLPMFILISLVIPLLTIFAFSKFMYSIPALHVVYSPILIIIAVIFTLGVSFYSMFYLKRIDFNEKCTFSSVIRDIIQTKSHFLEYSKIHTVFILILSVLIVLTLIKDIVNPESISSELKTDLLEIINTALLPVYTSFFFVISSAALYVLGIVYIGYGMANKEGAKILTIQANNKYPEIKLYLLKRNLVSGIVYISAFILDLIIDNPVFNIAIKIMAIGVSAYIMTVYYIISRDLYGGKPNKQTVKQEDESLNALPSIS